MWKKRALSWEEVLGAQVVVNEAARTEERKNELLIVIPRRKTFWINVLSFFLVVPREKKMVLDELGAEVYHSCQKGLAVSEIIQGFEKQHNRSQDYSRQSVLLYLKNLAQRGIIGFVVKGVAQPKGRKDG